VQNFVQSLAKAVTRNDDQRRNAAAERSAPARPNYVKPGSKGPSAAPMAHTAPAVGQVIPAAEGAEAAAGHTLHPEILSTIGEEFSQHLTNAMEVVTQAVANPRTLSTSLTQIHFLMDGLRRKSMALQQISRLAQNRIRQSHEKLSLPVVAQGVLDERQAEYAALGMVVNTRYKPVEIIVDPGLLVSLIVGALDWVTEFGSVVRMDTSMKNWPQHGILSFVAAQGVRTQNDIDHNAAVNQSIAWHLLQQIAQVMGVGLTMDETVTKRTLTIEFPRTVVALEGMTIMEMDIGPNNSSFGTVNSNFIAGLQVLFISADYEMINRVRDICKSMSLRFEHAPSVEKAERMCEQQVPHLIVCEEDLCDARYDALLEDLQRHTPGFPTILVSENSHGFEFSDWSGNSKSRVSRDQIAEQLPGAMTIELTRTI
jgi:hypothetical protein